MGSSASTIPKEEQDHPTLFYEGQSAANEGRFTVSELCFTQALLAHPGREFWEKLTKTVFHKSGKANAGGVMTPVSPRESGFPSQAQGGEAKPAPQLVPSVLPTVLGTAENPLQLDTTARGAAKSSTATDSSRSSPSTSSLTHGGNAAGADAAATAEGSMAQTMGGTTDITLPLDGELKDLMNYVRLLADMAHVYLRLLPKTQHEAKVITLASRYTVMTITFTQVLLNIFTLMKYDGTAPVVAAVSLGRGGRRHNDSSASSVVSREERTETPKMSKGMAKASADVASKCFTLTLVAAECRYYFTSFLINYVQLLLRTLVEQTERKRQLLVYSNLMDHLDAVYGALHELAEEYPDEYLSRVIMAHVPAGNGRERRTPSNSQGASSHPQTVSASLGLSSDAHQHLYTGGRVFSGVQSALTSLLAVHGVRLCVQEGVATRARAKIRSPAERMSSHYLWWYSAVKAEMIPGRNLYTLKMSLARSSGGGQKEDNDTSAAEIVVGPPLSAANVEGDVEMSNVRGSPPGTPRPQCAQDGDDERTLPENPGPQLRKTMETFARGRGAASVYARFKGAFQLNPRQRGDQLDLSDAKTLVMLSLEEGCFIALQALRLSVLLRFGCGQREAATRYVKATEDLISSLYGPQSPEIKMTRYAHQVYYT